MSKIMYAIIRSNEFNSRERLEVHCKRIDRLSVPDPFLRFDGVPIIDGPDPCVHRVEKVPEGPWPR